MINVEYDTINVSPTIKNINAYTKINRNFSDDSDNVLLYCWLLSDTNITMKVAVRSNRIPSRTDSVLTYIHSGGKN